MAHSLKATLLTCRTGQQWVAGLGRMMQSDAGVETGLGQQIRAGEVRSPWPRSHSCRWMGAPQRVVRAVEAQLPSVRPRLQFGDVSVAVSKVMCDLMDQYMADQTRKVGAGPSRMLNDRLTVEEDVVRKSRNLHYAACDQRRTPIKNEQPPPAADTKVAQRLIFRPVLYQEADVAHPRCQHRRYRGERSLRHRCQIIETR